ncbi:synaptonemal complex protein 2-like [Apteryx mantelli]|uniref:Synaptonemal complex protein 2-like n=1 Tax=Apteryx mantelli TaxID=2696672 RepID=A0ABM4E6Z1_9AVES
MVSWFERTRTFVILIDLNENRFLMILLEDFFDCALVICRCSSKGKKELVNLFLPELGHLVTETNVCCTLRQEALRTLNSILDSVPREERKKFPLSEEMCSLTKDLAKSILEVGDYDLQVALSEALCRLMTKKWRDDLVHHWFEDNYLAEAFKEIKDREFETDCRKFLNQLNERLGDEGRVYSFPCISAFADMNEVKKPSDEKLEEFWIDFNAGSQSVTFYVDSSEGALWDSVRLSKEAVSSYSLKEEGGEKTVKIYMKIPAIVNKNEATKIKISFSAEFEILDALRKVLGDEKMMINMAEEEPIQAGEQARQNEAVIPESSNPPRKKNPSNSENTDSLSDILASQHSEQLTDTKTVTSVTMITVSQQTDLEDANPAKKSKTPSPRMKAKPSEKPLEEEPIEESTPKFLGTPFSFLKDVAREKRNRKSSLVKQKTEARKDFYDFENSDSASHEKVAEAKGRILGQKPSSQNQRDDEMENKTRDSSKLERRRSDYRKHLFSESNSENASTGQSEKSWILDSQKRLLPRSLDYTRKRPRVRSKLKVLPVSSASSGSDYQTKKLGVSRPRAQKETLKKKGTSDAKGDDLPTVEVADETHSELEGDPVSLNASAEDYSNIEEKPTQKFPDASGKLSREEEMFKRKDSDMLAGTVLKRPKLSSWETSHLSSDTSYKPRRLFNSIEKEKETKTGQKMDEMDDTFFSKILSEDVSDSGVITAFESFTSQLKKLFWSRYKRMETCAQNALRTSEKNVSALLNQIHECRLNKLETFQKIVVEELASLEKETQVLANLEKDAVDFWNAQALKLNSFCNQQKQRIQSVDSALGETAKSFVETIQNTTYERPVKKAAENNVFIVPSD